MKILSQPWLGLDLDSTVLFKHEFVLFHTFDVLVSTLVLIEFFAHTHTSFLVFTLGFHPTPVTLDQDCSVLKLFLLDVVNIASIKVLDEIVLTAHALNSLLDLIALLHKSSLIRLISIELLVHRRSEVGFI